MSSTSANPLLPAVPPDWPFGSRPAFREPASSLDFDGWLQPEQLPTADPEPVAATSANTATEMRLNEKVQQETPSDPDTEAAIEDPAESTAEASQSDDEPTAKEELPSEVVQALSGAAALVVAADVPATPMDLQSGEPVGQVTSADEAAGGEAVVPAAAIAAGPSPTAISLHQEHPGDGVPPEPVDPIPDAAVTSEKVGNLGLIASANECAGETVASEHSGEGKSQQHDGSGPREPDSLANQSQSPALGNAEPRPLDIRPDQSNQPAESKGLANNSPAPPINSTAAADALRIRLPAEVMAPAGASDRPGPGIEIDAARLLHRVARAFAQAADRSGEVTIRLSPPELGALRLEVQVREGVLTAHLQAETPEARTAILENLPALRERLAEQGVRIERFDVDLMNRQSGGSPQQAFSDQRETPRTWRPASDVNAATKQPSSVPHATKTTPAGAGRLNVIV